MTDIQIFSNPQFGEIRTLADEANEPLFCAADVCKALGYSNPRDAISRHVDEGDVAKRDTPTTSGVQTMTFVNESGLYSLIFGSKLDSAKVFKRWVTSEVLPTIRKLVSNGEIPCYKSGKSNRNYFKRTEIDDWRAASRRKTNRELEIEAATKSAIGRR